MAVQYRKIHGGEPTETTVWVDEPDDLYGDDDLVREQRQIALDVIKRMDASRKWERMDAVPPSIDGPDDKTKTEPVELEPKAKTPEPPEKPKKTSTEKAPEGLVPTLPQRPQVQKKAKGSTSVTQATVRAWAEENGIEVNSSGRLPQSLVERYLAEHGS